jgi:O-antigen ligase
MERPTNKLISSLKVKNKLGKAAFYFVLALVFLRFSMLHEMIAYVFRLDTFILYLVGPPALFCTLLTGGIRRTFKNRCALYYLCFVAWMVLAAPFSSWRGGSVESVSAYLKTNVILCPVIGGLACTWNEIRHLLMVIAVGGVLSAIFGIVFPGAWSGRVGLAFGVLANPDDYAAHLLLVLPFLLWIVLDVKRSIILRVLSSVFICIEVYLILATGSRGALIAMIAGTCFFFSNATKIQRRIMLALVPLSVIVLLSVVPAENLRRLVSYSNMGNSQNEEANESQEIRQYLFQKSVEFTLSHPVFGVGPGQFPAFEGQYSGTHGMWRSTHNSFTQISSECGIPAFIFYLLAILSAFGVLWKTYRSASRTSEHQEIALFARCMMMGLLSHFIAVAFLNFGYMFQLPAMIGLVCAISYAARRELNANHMKDPSSGIKKRLKKSGFSNGELMYEQQFESKYN